MKFLFVCSSIALLLAACGCNARHTIGETREQDTRNTVNKYAHVLNTYKKPNNKIEYMLNLWFQNDDYEFKYDDVVLNNIVNSLPQSRIDKSDAWGNPYYVTIIQENQTQKIGIYSCGPDGKSITLGNDADDIKSW